MTTGADREGDPFSDPDAGDETTAAAPAGSTLACARDVTLTLGTDSLVVLGAYPGLREPEIQRRLMSVQTSNLGMRHNAVDLFAPVRCNRRVRDHRLVTYHCNV